MGGIGSNGGIVGSKVGGRDRPKLVFLFLIQSEKWGGANDTSPTYF